MKQKIVNQIFAVLGAFAVICSSSLSIIGMYEPKKPNKFIN